MKKRRRLIEKLAEKSEKMVNEEKRISSKKKVAFVVEENYWNKHRGVKNLFMSMYYVLEKKYLVDIVLSRQFEDITLWFRVTNDQLLSVELLSVDHCTELNRENDFLEKLYRELVREEECVGYLQFIGSSLKNEGYDLCIITNPWLLRFPVEIGSKKLAGIVHDVIANEVVFLNERKDFTWSRLHQNGYRYFNKNCDYLLMNSETTFREYSQYYSYVEGPRKIVLPPIIPKSFDGVNYSGEVRKENAIVLAAPFDIRKGLKQLPNYFTEEVQATLDKIYIFGKPRCSTEDFLEFILKLPIEKVEYYPEASPEKVVNLYKRSKVLLFPSLNEGLGIPILEAQICGCRVVTTDKDPMRGMVLDGGYLLSGSYEDDSQKILAILEDAEYSYEALSRQACERFSLKSLDVVLEDIMT